MTVAWIAIAAIAAMLAVAAVQRFPVWNPVYFFGVLFALQIGAGFFFAGRLGMDLPAAFSVRLAGAYVLCVAVLLLLSLRDRELVVANPDLREQFANIELTPGAVRMLYLIILFVAVHNTVVNLIVTIRWEALPVVAYNAHRQEIAQAMSGMVLPQDVARPFRVPFFGVVADHLVNAGVVAYLVLVFCPSPDDEEDSRTGLASVPAWVHGLFGIVVLNAAVIPRRNPLLVATATAALILYLLRRVSLKALVAGALILVVGTVGFGQWRRGTSQFPAAEELQLPPVANNTVVWEPLVYAGAGVPNFYAYRSEGHPPTGGELHLSSLFPRPIDRALDLEVNRTVMLERMFGDGYTIPGQTFRTPWFEFFFDFGWTGVYVLALLFPAGVHWLYRRTLAGARRNTPSVAFFVLAKVIFLFPFINVLFQLPFWTTVGMALLIDWQLLRSAGAPGWERPWATVVP